LKESSLIPTLRLENLADDSTECFRVKTLAKPANYKEKL